MNARIGLAAVLVSGVALTMTACGGNEPAPPARAPAASTPAAPATPPAAPAEQEQPLPPSELETQLPAGVREAVF